MAIIKKISSSETFLVRQPVLRAGKPLESCRFDGDDLEITHHFEGFPFEIPDVGEHIVMYKKI